jgi:hypothetical protein
MNIKKLKCTYYNVTYYAYIYLNSYSKISSSCYICGYSKKFRIQCTQALLGC